MNTMDLLMTLTRAPVDARIVLQLPNGDEIDVTAARHHCQLVVLKADVPEPGLSDNSAHIEEALAQFPDEDFLEEAIKMVRSRSFDRDDLAEMLCGIQSEVVRAAEYGRDELNKALEVLHE